MAYLIERLKEPSTWRGGILFLTGFGVYLSPEQINAIIAIGVALAGAVGIFFPDKFKEKGATNEKMDGPTPIP